MIVGAIAVLLFAGSRSSRWRSAENERADAIDAAQSRRAESRADRLRRARSCSASRWCRSTASRASTCSASSSRKAPRAQAKASVRRGRHAHGHACSSSPSVNSKLPWAFQSEAAERRSASGQAHRSAGSTRPTTPTRRSSATRCRASRRARASLYFNKTECFCFTEQTAEGRRSRGACRCASSSIRSCRRKSPSSRSRTRSYGKHRRDAARGRYAARRCLAR